MTGGNFSSLLLLSLVAVAAAMAEQVNLQLQLRNLDRASTRLDCEPEA